MREKVIFVANIVGFALLVAAGWIAWDHLSEKRRSEHSLREFELRRAVEAGNQDTARKILKDLEKNKEFRPLALSYKLQMEKDGDLRSVLKDIVESTKDAQLKSLYIERYAYELFRHNQREQALKELAKINSEDFNYVSAMLLKAQILRSLNKNREANEILQSLLKDQKETYFANLAYALFLKGGGNEQPAN